MNNNEWMWTIPNLDPADAEEQNDRDWAAVDVERRRVAVAMLDLTTALMERCGYDALTGAQVAGIVEPGPQRRRWPADRRAPAPGHRYGPGAWAGDQLRRHVFNARPPEHYGEPVALEDVRAVRDEINDSLMQAKREARHAD